MKYLMNNIEFNNNLNEAFEFWNWLLYSRKAKKLGQSIANARYNGQKRELEMKNEKIKNGEESEIYTPDEIAELKTYEDEAVNLENTLQVWIQQRENSEYLTNVAKEAELNQENLNIKKLRQMSLAKKDKDRYTKLEELNSKHANLLQKDNKETEDILNKNKNVIKQNAKKGIPFDINSHKDQKQRTNREKMLKQIELEKARLQLSKEKQNIANAQQVKTKPQQEINIEADYNENSFEI